MIKYRDYNATTIPSQGKSDYTGILRTASAYPNCDTSLVCHCLVEVAILNVLLTVKYRTL